ncbi:MAG TPA: prepilin-type N-terminal cleavage/methylation domain-containing protein [Bryobacteraceae bacterium]|nr:prepilin-type N-terminal cleavage/methylation domain-containing protein [Bryobacteraceae bacterium]
MHSRSSRRQRGFSLIELLIVVAIVLILAAVAVPKLNQNRMLANETAAVQQIQTIHKAQVQYQSQFNRFANSLAELGPGQGGGTVGPAAADLIPGDLALGRKSGYIFTVAGTPTGYQVNANPQSYNRDGRRTFYSDHTLVIRENWGQEPATVASPELGSEKATGGAAQPAAEPAAKQ